MLTFARALPTARLTAEAAWQLRVCSLVHLKASAYLADIGSRAGLPQVDLWERALLGGELQGLGQSQVDLQQPLRVSQLPDPGAATCSAHAAAHAPRLLDMSQGMC